MTAQEISEDVRDGVWFSIHIDSEEFVAFISGDALAMRFKASGAGQSQLDAAYRENREAIHAKARRKFLNGSPRPIRLSAKDF